MSSPSDAVYDLQNISIAIKALRKACAEEEELLRHLHQVGFALSEVSATDLDLTPDQAEALRLLTSKFQPFYRNSSVSIPEQDELVEDSNALLEILGKLDGGHLVADDANVVD